MHPAEALTLLIKQADNWVSLTKSTEQIVQRTPEETNWLEELEIAISIGQAMLNTAIPVVRFRCFVQVDPISKKKTPVRDEFVITATNVAALRSGLVALRHYKVDVHVTLWEQRAQGADMLSGYQGPTKSERYESWLESLSMYEQEVPHQ
jgi:hypothetical protein